LAKIAAKLHPRERTGLHKTQMMRIRRTPTANQAGLFDDMPDMVAVTNATRFGEFKDALVDLWCVLVQALIGECSGNSLAFATASLAAKASSTFWASAADNWFFAASRRCAHSAGSSVELRP
jgi:hypothetical protein